MATEKATLLRKIPAVEALLQDADICGMSAGIPRRIVVDSARFAVEKTRKRLQEAPNETDSEQTLRAEIVVAFRRKLGESTRIQFRKVINATGIILHTGLGRAVLPAKALGHVQEALAGYSVLQLDTRTGKRSKRDGRIEELLKLLTGAQAATVVNNNAAATMLVLNTLGNGREVIVSRGQLVEIGGSFRLPDVMAASGAKLVEVGSTNKTHLRDYENAINENTAAILRVHPSNYKIVGFSAEVSLKEMVDLAHAHELPLIDDVGAGALIDFSQFGFEHEPMLSESLAEGSDLVTSSADKLIGASQGGIILGRADLVEQVRKNPISRMVRVDKMTLAVLETTLSLFLDEAVAMREIPTLAMLSRDLDDITAQAGRIAKAVASGTSGANVTTQDGFSQMGSGSLPEQNLPTCVVAVEPKNMTPDKLAARLRGCEVPVFARIQNDKVLLDPRTLQDGEEQILIDQIKCSLDVSS